MEAIVTGLLKKLLERQIDGSAERDRQGAINAMNGTDNANEQALNQVFPQQNQGTLTGASAPVQQETNTLSDYQNYLKEQNKYSDDVINGVAKGLNSGYKEIADWQNQYAKSAEGIKNGFTIPQTEAEIALAKSTDQKYDGGIQQDTKKQSPSWIDTLAKNLGDIRTGYEENRDTPFKAENMSTSNNNSLMKHIGEGAGTLARMASNPTLQGVVSGIATGAMTGNPLAGLVNGYKIANQKSNSNMYQDLLQKDGIDVKKGGFAGDIDRADYTTMSNIKTQREASERALKQLEEKIKHDQAMEEYYAKQAETNAKYKDGMLGINQQKVGIQQQNANTSKQNANTREYNAHNKSNTKSSSKTKSQANSNSYVIGRTPSGAKVKVPVNKVKEFKQMGGKIVG